MSRRVLGPGSETSFSPVDKRQPVCQLPGGEGPPSETFGRRAGLSLHSFTTLVPAVVTPVPPKGRQEEPAGYPCQVQGRDASPSTRKAVQGPRYVLVLPSFHRGPGALSQGRGRGQSVWPKSRSGVYSTRVPSQNLYHRPSESPRGSGRTRTRYQRPSFLESLHRTSPVSKVGSSSHTPHPHLQGSVTTPCAEAPLQVGDTLGTSRGVCRRDSVVRTPAHGTPRLPVRVWG